MKKPRAHGDGLLGIGIILIKRMNIVPSLTASDVGCCNTPPQCQIESAYCDPNGQDDCPISGLVIHFDYLSGIGKCKKIEHLINYLCDDSATEQRQWKMNKHCFTHQVLTVDEGIFVQYYEDSEAKDEYKIIFRLTLSGLWFSRHELVDVLRYFVGLNRVYKLRSTRLDIAIDDYRKTLNIFNVYQEAFNHNMWYLEGFQYVESGRRLFGVRHIAPTTYLGSTRNLIRIYDGAPTHGKDMIRLEGQYRENKAACMYLEIVNMVSRLRSTSSSLMEIEWFMTDTLLGTVDFRDRVSRHLKRSPRQKWWQDFIDYVKAIPKRFLPKRELTYAKDTLEWITRQVSKTLALIGVALGTRGMYEYIMMEVRKAEERFTEYDVLKCKALISYFRKQV